MSEAEALRRQILELSARYAELAHAPKPFVAGESAVAVSGKVYGAPELVNLVDSSLDFWLTTGRFNDEFEAKLAKAAKSRYALTVNSGSSANLLAVTALTSPSLGVAALKPGDEVITCATGFPTTVNPVLQNGLVPVFVDVSLPTYNIDVAAIEAAITPRTRAIVLAHTLGNPFDLGAITAIAKKHDLRLIEDCCDALGAKYDGEAVGSFGEIGTLSFYPAHHITTGEGGAVFTKSSQFKRILESLRDWGRDCWCPPGHDNTCKQRFSWQLGGLPVGYDHKYIYSHLGYNLKMTDMQAAVGVKQLDRLDEFVAARNANYAYLRAGLKRFEEFLILPEAMPNAEPSWFGLPLTIRPGTPYTRDLLVNHLNRARIGTRYLFGGNLIHQPYMKGQNYRVAGPTPNADLVMNATFWIGVFPGLEQPHLDYVLASFDEFFRLYA
ncbi:lipopolysaccharide biosynthesis protein RfbH [Acidocella aromatica]|uniref:CDP-6-deoxy-D-xylo-4-hexulose-3-dehydrase n=1 Tax=Acidocella aromatica TaxID=1303579 RepID=A0A840VBG7_9PROT|nr:lipopolysaccharide biosynthesis protein RfbH [Acidocella aromatica]MBB5372954.1 CDP-6-deoxy-D-xylo-4-hexulose-3-dehydrase [Acidocella aromatica]